MTMTEHNIIVRPDGQSSSEYPLLNVQSIKEMLGIYQDNIAPHDMSSFELPRIKCPPGASTVWRLDTPDGKEHTREIEGIVLAWRLARAYSRRSLHDGGGGQPPDCSSKDGFYGVGDPGGPCADCRLSKFGSSTKGGGRGQACKQMRQLLLVRPRETVPYLLSVPPTSLRAASQYFFMLLGRQVPHWGVTTKIRLERTKNQDDGKYARMVFTAGRRLTPAERDVIQPYRRQMRDLLASIEVEATDYTVSEELPPQLEE
jgi:hypothetical protein